MNWNLITRTMVASVGGFNLGVCAFMYLSLFFPVSYWLIAAVGVTGFTGLFKFLKD
jgi:hypothetical protein